MTKQEILRKHSINSFINEEIIYASMEEYKSQTDALTQKVVAENLELKHELEEQKEEVEFGKMHLYLHKRKIESLEVENSRLRLLLQSQIKERVRFPKRFDFDKFWEAYKIKNNL